MSSFKTKQSTIKGTMGEDICFNILKARGHTIYRPDDGEKRHPIDSLVVHKTRLTVVAADVKTKPCREAYPDTGIDTRHYAEYDLIQIRNNIRVFLFFVDENKCAIYGNYLDRLKQRKEVLHNGRMLIYPLHEKNIVYFPLNSMIKLATFSADEAQKLINLRKTKFHIDCDLNQPAIDGLFTE